MFDKGDPRNALMMWGRIDRKYVHFREDGGEYERGCLLDKVFMFYEWREDIVKAVQEYGKGG
ncbi:MAG: hypothetical protein LZ173_05855 [Thaumarchaeota archaeon]|nr:hypothetical protein [Candidatus Geocrenenecus arthurdayi]